MYVSGSLADALRYIQGGGSLWCSVHRWKTNVLKAYCLISWSGYVRKVWKTLLCSVAERYQGGSRQVGSFDLVCTVNEGILLCSTFRPWLERSTQVTQEQGYCWSIMYRAVLASGTCFEDYDGQFELCIVHCTQSSTATTATL